VKKIRTSDDDSVLEYVEKTYPNYVLCSPENLVRLIGKKKISNKPRFYNERSEEILKFFHDMNSTIHHMPDIYLEKIFASKDFSTFFHSQVFLYLENKIKSKKQDEETIALMIKLYSSFLTLGLSGILNIMPSEFTHILEPKTKELFTLIEAIQQYTERISPSQARKTTFPFNKFKEIRF